jgi:hypothetical protein
MVEDSLLDSGYGWLPYLKIRYVSCAIGVWNGQKGIRISTPEAVKFWYKL